MKLLNGFVSLFILVFIVSCGSDPAPDPRVDALVEKMSFEKGWTDSQARCTAEALKKGLTNDQWDQFLAMVGMSVEQINSIDVEDELVNAISDGTLDEIGNTVGDTLAMLPVLMRTAYKCGIPMDWYE
ncbi:hypothetical protein N9403_00920 [Gammaproteobacteria bacterium]|nr:hypothetical protein [Gammaproteobacteria bacterium]